MSWCSGYGSCTSLTLRSSLPSGEEDQSEQILSQLEDAPVQREVRPGVVVNIEDPEEYNSEVVKAQVMANVQSALQKQQNTVSSTKSVCTCMTYCFVFKLFTDIGY